MTAPHLTKKAQEYIAKDTISRKRAEVAASQIATACGPEVEPGKMGNDGTVKVWPGVAGCYCLDVQARDEGPTVSARLEGLAPETMIKVLFVLKEAAR